MKNKFKFHLPLDLVKAGEGSDKKMVLGGIASTMDKDSDGEFLDPQGFELDYLQQYGFANWNHSKKPEDIVGEIVKSKVDKRGLYLETELFPENPLSKNIYNLAEILYKKNSKRRLGFSIEGKVLERDLLNPKIVKKAKITGVAITPVPKNHNTIADIIKGEFLDEETLNKSEDEFVFDEISPQGMRIQVDKDFNISIFDTTDPNKKPFDIVTKDLSTSSGSALIPESLEGKPKILTKSEAYEKIIEKFPNISFNNCKKLLNLASKIDSLKK